MPSPFPGMDPYLEPHWLDIHSAMVMYARRGLNRTLPKGLVASAEERVAIESDDDEREFFPDVGVFTSSASSTAAADDSNEGGTRIALPYRLVTLTEPPTERFIQIIEGDTERLVTVIEFLSPTNKRAAGLRAFRRKRADLLASKVNVVEVDLVRAGDWQALLQPHKTKHATTYRLSIRTPRDPDAVYFQPISSRERLPITPVPLRPTDPPVTLDLQKLLDDAYDDGRYPDRIDYRRDPEPPLDPNDAAWADTLLREAGRR